MVIMLISLAMAVSFAVVHSQGTALRIQQNSGLRAIAMQAAQAGMAAALREACEPDWAGVDTTFTRTLSAGTSFSATYVTGDSTLNEADSDWAEYPYRVTVLVTGNAFDPDNSLRQAKHTIRAVIRLVTQAVDDEPSGWNEINDNTFCQWENDILHVNIPCRIQGSARIRGELRLSEEDMYWSDSVRSHYCQHLNYMRQNGRPDCRPITGPLQIAPWEQNYATLDLLDHYLGVSRSTASTSKTYTWTMPLASGSYRLYPGGNIYYAETIDSDLQDKQLKPNPKTNPLGIFISDGETRFSGGVSLEGTLISYGDVKMFGGSNSLSSPSLPPYEHRDMSESNICLPGVISNDDFYVEPGASVDIKGLVMVKDKLTVKNDYQDSQSLVVQGKVTVKKLDIKPRIEWQKSRDWWNYSWNSYDYNFFYYFLFQGWCFPEYVYYYTNGDLDPQPRIVIEPEAENTRYHWYNGNNPLFRQAKDASGNDSGLRWELISWTDNP